jgi:hypothetical protein
MKHRAPFSSLASILPAFVAVSALCAAGCDTTIGGDSGTNANTSGAGGTSSGAGGTSNGGTSGASGTSNTGGTGMVDPMSPCNGAADPRLVVATQRLVRLTRLELVNTERAYNLIDDATATAIVQDGTLGNIGDETQRLFPPLATQSETSDIDTSKFPTLFGIAERAAQYVFDHFAEVTGCATATDACATTYLTTLAARAYRRPLSAEEQARLTALYTLSKAQTVNGWMVTSTVQQATQNGVHAILVSPQVLWRSELGDPAGTSSVPGSVPLTNHELATQLSYFLTNLPPDDQLRAAADAGTLRNDLMTHAERLLATPQSRAWLKTMVFTYFRLNALYSVTGIVDWAKFGITDVNKFLVDMHDESDRFLDHTLWNLTLPDLLTSKTTFLNTNLASVYGVAPPAGATETNFVQAELPADQRTGIITLGAFIVTAAGADRESLVHRALNIKNTLLCLETPGPPDTISDLVTTARAAFDHQTAQEQAAARAMNEQCVGCHASFDSYGLVLDGYDNLARWRTSVTLVDGRMAPVDAHTTLPDELGNKPVNGAVEMARELAASPSFTNCMATMALKYAMAELETAPVRAPAAGEPGCAAREVADIYTRNGGTKFIDLVRAAITAPSFSLRVRAQ